jgi:hypothetical protein
LIFQPSHPDFEGIISTSDLNCAASPPNALYGSKISLINPSIQAANPGQTFAVHSLKIKPLNFPVGVVTINMGGLPSNRTAAPLRWSVEFPAGFHNVLDVKMEEFTKQSWKDLKRLEIWAEFHYHDFTDDEWEFCIDDLEFEIGPST